MRYGTRQEYLALGACLLSLYLLFLPANPLTSPDEEILLRTAVSLIHGNRGAVPPLPMGFATKTGTDGREYAQYGLGLPAAAGPFLAAVLVSQGRLGDGFQVVAYRPFRLSAAIFNLLVTVCTVLLVRLLLMRLGLSRQASLAGALMYGVVTVAWPHGRTFFTEPLAALCILGAVALLTQDKADRPAVLLCAGLLYGWAILTRLDSLMAGPGIAWSLAYKATRPADFLRRSLLVGIPVALILAGIAGYNAYRFGGVVSTGYEDQTEGVRFSTPLLVGLHGNLLTPGRSLFVYSPILILAVPGIVTLWRTHRAFAIAAGLVVAGYLGAMSKWQNWAGGSDWGPRHIFQITPWLAVAASLWFFSQARRGRWIWLLLALSLAVQILGLLTDPVQVIREANLDYNVIGKQMSVYHPQRCTPVLHTQWLGTNAPNLLLVDLMREEPISSLLFLIPLCTLGMCARFLFLCLRTNEHVERTISTE